VPSVPERGHWAACAAAAKAGQIEAGQINASPITAPDNHAFARERDGSGQDELQLCMRESLDNIGTPAKADGQGHGFAAGEWRQKYR
jgi:hypothetical protein